MASVAGDRATAAFGARRPWSRTQAISDSVRLPPAESPATNTALAGRGAVGAVVQHPAVGGAAVFNARQARVLGHQAVVDGQHRGAGDFGELGCQAAVALRAAHGPRAAVDVEQAAPRVGVRRQHPFGGHAGDIDRGDPDGRIVQGKRVVHVLAQPGQVLAARHVLQRAGNAAERCHHRLVLRTGRRIDRSTLPDGPVKRTQVRPAQVKDLNEPQHHHHGQGPCKEFGQLLLPFKVNASGKALPGILAKASAPGCRRRDGRAVTTQSIADRAHPTLEERQKDWNSDRYGECGQAHCDPTIPMTRPRSTMRASTPHPNRDSHPSHPFQGNAFQFRPFRQTNHQEAIMRSHIGLIGIGVMGENLALNMESHGFSVSVFDASVEKVNLFIARKGQGKNISGFSSVGEFIDSLQHPQNHHDDGSSRQTRR